MRKQNKELRYKFTPSPCKIDQGECMVLPHVSRTGTIRRQGSDYKTISYLFVVLKLLISRTT